MNTIKEFGRIMATQTELALATIGTDGTPNVKIVNYYLILRIMSYTLQHLKILKKYMSFVNFMVVVNYCSLYMLLL